MTNNPIIPDMEAAFHRIPTELLDEITGYVGHAYSHSDFAYPGVQATIRSRNDLCALSLVTRGFRASAQRCLMRTIALSDQGTYCSCYAQFYCLLRTLLDSPDLAQKVRTLTLNVHCDRYVQFGYMWEDYNTNELSAYSRVEERDEILNRCSEIIQSSSFSTIQKAEWKYDLCQPWITPICGVILTLIPNMESLSLLDTGSGQKQDDRPRLAPFFGWTLREDKKVDLPLYRDSGGPQRQCSYEHQLGVTRRPELDGLRDVAGLANLRTLRLNSQAKVSILGLKHLQRITNFDVAISKDWWATMEGTPPPIIYTGDERDEFQNINSLRFAATMSSVQCNVNRYFEALAAFVGVMPSLRQLTLYGESEPYKAHTITGWVTEHLYYRDGSSLSLISYPTLLAALECTSTYLESLTLPTGLWSLGSITSHPPASFCHFERLQYLCVPRVTLLGTKSIPLPDSCTDWKQFYARLREHPGGQWLDSQGIAHKGLFTKRTNPEVVLQNPENVLPKSLRHLKVVDADGQTCSWLATLLVPTPLQVLPLLERIQIVLRKERSEFLEKWSDAMVSIARSAGTDIEVSFEMERLPSGQKYDAPYKYERFRR